MKRFVLTFIVFFAFLICTNGSYPLLVSVAQSIPTQRELSLPQIEELIKNRTPDNAIAIQIKRRGINFRPGQDILNALQKMGAGLKTMQALKAAYEEKKEVSMASNAEKPKLWITYAWDNNKGGDFDFLVQELKSAGVNVTFDKIALIPGQRLWQQIAERIEDPDLSGWAILLTKESLQSEACKEELAYALDRTLSTKGRNFPLLGLIHQVEVRDVPLPLRTRLLISLRDSQWTKLVLAGLKKEPLQQTANSQSRYIWQIVPNYEGDKKKIAIWVRPRFGELRHWRFIFPANAKFIGNMIGAPEQGLSGMRNLTMNYRGTTLIEQASYEVVIDGAGDTVTPGLGCFIVFEEPFPKFVAFAVAKGWNADKPDEIDPNTSEVFWISR